MVCNFLTRLIADLRHKVKLDSSSATLSISEGDIVIFVVGPTGSGKSWFIKQATRAGLVESSREYHPSTTKAQAIRCELTDDAKKDLQKEGVKSIVFVDTPSFLTGRDDIDALQEIKKMIKRTQSKPGYLGMIYMHRIESDPVLEPIWRHLQGLKGVPWISDSPHPVRVHIVASYDTTSSRTSNWKMEKHKSSLEGQMVLLSKSRWLPTMNQGYFRGEPEAAWRAVEELLKSMARNTYMGFTDSRHDNHDSCEDVVENK